MQSSVGIGRIGPLNVFLHYTWLIALVLGLWWLALLWLPDNYAGWSGWTYWLAAVVVLILYIITTILHEVVHTAVGKSGQRTLVLYPFGAAAPFRLSTMAPARGVMAALAAPIMNIVLGGAMLLLGNVIGTGEGILAFPGAVLSALGWLNLAQGIVNLIPGIPFDGGWALALAAYWYTGDREAGQGISRTIGEVAALGIVLVGAWRGLTTNSWLDALALVLVGWMARDAGALSRQRASVRGALNSVTAADIMDGSRTGGTVAASDTVADLVLARPRLAPEEPVAVTDDSGTLVGITSLAAAEEVLQGNWATTPVRAITTPIGDADVVRVDDPVMQVLAMSQRRGGETAELAFPVVEGGRLVGSINVNRLQGFASAGQQFGMEEAVVTSERRGPAGLIGALLPAAVVIAAMAVFGNIAFRTNPAELREMTAETAEAPLVFSEFTPATDAIVGSGASTISVSVSGPNAITTSTLALDGQPLESEMSGASPLTQTVRAEVPGLTLGLHNVSVAVGTETGRSKTTSWQFRVSYRGSENGGEGQPKAEPPLTILRYSPSLGQRVLAGTTDEQVWVDVRSDAALSSATITLDDHPLDSSIEPAAQGKYRVTAAAPELSAGPHRVRAELFGAEVGFYSAEWTFSAVVPDEANVYFAETKQFLSEPFLSFWRDNGGVRVFGFPISDRIPESDEVTGESYTAKYFERARMELHTATGNAVVLGRLGARFHDPEPPAAPLEGAQHFAETGHNLQGSFLAFWERNGGLGIFGFPITEELKETNAADGKEYTVQYFERNRFEYHPELAGTPDEVQLGLLGTRLYRETYEE